MGCSDWAKSRTVTLRFKAEEKCKFLRKVVREVESDTSQVSEGILGKFKSYTLTKVTEYFWQFDVAYELFAFCGNDPERRVSIMARAGSLELKTSGDATPRPVSVVRPNVDMPLGWLWQHVDSMYKPSFTIKRNTSTCRTPRRNVDVEAALGWFAAAFGWAHRVSQCAYFLPLCLAHWSCLIKG
jgi:hypothetical protein